MLFSSARLSFRAFSETDIGAFARLNADPDVMRYFPSVMTKEESRAAAKRITGHFEKYGYGYYSVFEKATEEFIGLIGFGHPQFESWFTPCVEIGWRMNKAFHGKGYATEGALACFGYGKKNFALSTVFSFTAVINKPSENVMKRIGMEKEGGFDHPLIAESSPLRRHVLYRINM
ncbi:MAG TPA: GNAT family N-acetyltransferase [Bacteroidia bacterium]|nr:GNAT family N-acetyltransferase [Bacteroidia bacterium]